MLGIRLFVLGERPIPAATLQLSSAAVIGGFLVSSAPFATTAGGTASTLRSLAPACQRLPSMKFIPVLLALLMASHAPSADQPNILLILADDLGWSDLGCYGGEIATPTLDGLAKGGVQFLQFYNSARCSPTRASILTGLHPHQAGFPNLGGRLIDGSVTIAEVARAAGYRTSIVGKWHLNEKTPPTTRGFDEFYGMLGGYNSCWQENPFYTRWPQERPKRTYAKDAFYATSVFADYAIDFIGQADGKPWLQYLAFNAPHFPLHAPEADIARYETLYVTNGWDAIRAERFARQQQLGLVHKDMALTPRAVLPPNRFNAKSPYVGQEHPAWDSLPEDRRRDLGRRMAIYAAMVDLMDRAIGRVVAHLKQTGQFDNTVIFFLSDNGACAEWDPFGFDGSSGPDNVLHVGETLKNMGTAGDYLSYGSAWAHTCNTPWRLFKHYIHEGGVRTPCIVHWPAGLSAHGVVPDAGYITDFMPTICALTGATYPRTRDGVDVLPHEGTSLLPILRGEALPARRIFIEHEGNRGVRDGEWKLVARQGQPWELYQISRDPGEQHDLATEHADRVALLSAAWDDWAARCAVTKKRAAKP
jgi:arylsulfatase A-like enzyme